MSFMPRNGRLVRRADVSRSRNAKVGGKLNRRHLDHDGDGRPGGSLPKAERKPKNTKAE